MKHVSLILLLCCVSCVHAQTTVNSPPLIVPATAALPGQILLREVFVGPGATSVVRLSAPVAITTDSTATVPEGDTVLAGLALAQVFTALNRFNGGLVMGSNMTFTSSAYNIGAPTVHPGNIWGTSFLGGDGSNTRVELGGGFIAFAESKALKVYNTSGVEKGSLTTAGVLTVQSCSGCGGGGPFVDNTDFIYNISDPTKRLQFDIGLIPTATARKITFQDGSYTLPGLILNQTFSGANTFSGALAFSGGLAMSSDITYTSSAYNIGASVLHPGNIWASSFLGGDGSNTRVELGGGFISFAESKALKVYNTSGVEKGSLTTAGVLTVQSCSGCGGGLPVVDTTGIVMGSSDATKIVRFEVDTLTTATTRALTVQDNDYILAGTNIAQTFTASPTFGADVLVSGARNSGMSVAPWNQTFSTDVYNETHKICYPGTAFATCWTLRLRPGYLSGAAIDVLDQTGGDFFIFDQANSRILTKNVEPNADATYQLGHPSLRYTTADFSSTVRMGGASSTGDVSPSADNSYDLGTSAATDWRTIRFQTSLIQNGNTRIDVNGRLTPTDIFPETHNTYFIGDSTHEFISAHARSWISYDTAAQLRAFITAGTAGSNTGSAIQAKNFSGTNVFDVGFGGVTTVTNLTVSSITGSAQCLEADSSGVVAGTGSACGTGGGGVTSLTASSPIGVSASTGAVNITCSTCVVTSSSPTLNAITATSLTLSSSLTGFTSLSGSVGSGNFFLRTFSGAPGCGPTPDGWIGVDTTNQRLFVCISGTNYYTQLAP